MATARSGFIPFVAFASALIGAAGDRLVSRPDAAPKAGAEAQAVLITPSPLAVSIVGGLPPVPDPAPKPDPPKPAPPVEPADVDPEMFAAARAYADATAAQYERIYSQTSVAGAGGPTVGDLTRAEVATTKANKQRFDAVIRKRTAELKLYDPDGRYRDAAAKAAGQKLARSVQAAWGTPSR